MANSIAARRTGAPTAAPPPSLTESQRRLLADPFRLEGEGDVAWQPPAVPPDASRVRAVIAELERGLAPVNPKYAEWCVQKLFVLPTQNGDGLSAAVMADNFIDACGHFPDDLWQTATLELLRGCTFRPSPAEMVKIAAPKFSERQRMLERCKRLLLPRGAKADEPAEQPLATRAERLAHTRDTWRRLGNIPRAANAERELAREQGRAPENWAA